MILHVFPSGSFATNAMIIGCSDTSEVAIIDPALGSANSLKKFIDENNLIPKIILITHSHWDHTGDVAKLKKMYNIPVAVHSADVKNLEVPGSDGIMMFESIEGAKAEKILQGGEDLPIGNTLWHVIHTPGHSPGGICFYNEKDKILISGDTLFQGSIGNLSFPTSTPPDMWESLKKLALLPSETKVFPGHGGSTSIGAEHWLNKAETIFA